ncbi:alpha/beta fold hydrolase [Nesterenkonia ebinurensis]|uniref:alpha/beta fold hydrolase n=1 Tax=Nesterenkonia ebinurensis TaxID=2608252 RepID=UPI001CC42647|nr:alpha/beta hydrolase [Nesterenkonia ebinurensis]
MEKSSGERDGHDMARPTAVAALSAGAVEYRFERRGDGVVVILHGGHMHAGLAVGEAVFIEADHSVLVVSRPGYGQTSLTAGPGPEKFAESILELWQHLGITRVAAVVGVSAGGPYATALAACSPDLVERVILQASVGSLPWPGRLARLVARSVFSPVTERRTWAMVRQLMRRVPVLGLKALLGGLSTSSSKEVLADVSAEHRADLIELFSRMRSQTGFRNDLEVLDQHREEIAAQPALIIHSRRDGSVPFRHAETLHEALPQSSLLETSAEHHLIWFTSDWPRVEKHIREFLASGTAKVG